MLKLFCQLVRFLLPPLTLIPHLHLVLTPCLIVCAPIYYILHSKSWVFVPPPQKRPQNLCTLSAPIVTFFSTTYSNASHPRAIWWNISSRFKFNFAYSAMLIISITSSISLWILILPLVLTLKELALASSVKLGIGMLFKIELLSVCASASSPCILL